MSDSSVREPGTWVETDLQWSPDGKWIAFDRWRQDQATLEWEIQPIGIVSVQGGSVHLDRPDASQRWRMVRLLAGRNLAHLDPRDDPRGPVSDDERQCHGDRHRHRQGARGRLGGRFHADLATLGTLTSDLFPTVAGRSYTPRVATRGDVRGDGPEPGDRGPPPSIWRVGWRLRS